MSAPLSIGGRLSSSPSLSGNNDKNGTVAQSLPPTRVGSFATLSGSYIGSVMMSHGGGPFGPGGRRRSSLSTHAGGYTPQTERKLSRTRKMSEALKMSPDASSAASAKAPRLMRIPTEVGDITKEWARLIVNQFLLKHDRPLVGRDEQIVDFSVKNCKESVGEFSCTYQVGKRLQ